MEKVVERYKILLRKKKDLDDKRISLEAVLKQKRLDLDNLCKDAFVKYKVSSVEALVALRDSLASQINDAFVEAKKAYPELEG